MSIPQLLVSMLLFIILFFGIGFLLNMLLRATWIMAFIYPLIVIMIIDKVRFSDYFINASSAFQSLEEQFISLNPADLLILTAGLFGAILSGIVIRILRKHGYQMF
jgi:hypothetical protein